MLLPNRRASAIIVKSMKAFSLSGRALVRYEFIPATIHVTEHRIASITPGADPHADVTTDGWIVPGFIDLQVNGAFGHDFTSDPGSVAQVAARLPETGATAFLPTVISSPLEKYPSILRDLERAILSSGDGAHAIARGAAILGVHLEGPYLNRNKAGAHDSTLLRNPSPADLQTYVGSALVRLVTLAPELPDAIEIIRALCARGIVVSAGHSAATYAQAMVGFDAGITWGTHLYNAMLPFAHREPGLVGALLSSDVPCGLIVDGIHAHPAAVATAYRAKGARGIALATDSMAAMGMGTGAYKLGERDVTVDENSARLRDGTLAGSILKMDQAIRNMIAFTGCSLADAVTMASATPARVLGLDKKGRIEIGCDADLILLDEKLCVQMTIARGEIVYRN